MAEVGIDIAGRTPKRVSDVPLGEIDTVVTLCAEEVCVVLPGTTRRESWNLPDPASAPAGEARMAAFRAVRDEIERRLKEMFPEA